MMTAPEHALIWCELREIYSALDAHAWLDTPHPALKDRRPKDCSFAEILTLIDQIKSGRRTRRSIRPHRSDQVVRMKFGRR